MEQLNAALLGRYRLEQALGQGGMATVYAARDLKHDRDVALKVLRPELTAAIGPERFLREVRVTAQLSHPHILSLLDSGEAAGFLFYTMPLVRDETLRQRLSRQGPLDVAEMIQIAGDIGAALDHAHRQGIVHRDVKPENILLQENEAVVADFGIAHATETGGDQRLTTTGLVIGTPAYMSPEQLVGEPVDSRSDVYALACLVYEMLTGEAPHSGLTLEAIRAKRLGALPPSVRSKRPDAPEAIDRAVARGLAVRPEERFSTAGGLVAALGPAPAPETWVTERRALAHLVRRPAVVVSVILALGLLGTAIAGQLDRRREARARALLPRIAQLADSGNFGRAYDLALSAEGALGPDSTLAALLGRVADRLTITSDPSGAEVYLQAFDPSGGRAPDSVRIGSTPIPDHRMARNDYRVVLRVPGRPAVERIASTIWQRAEGRLILFRRSAPGERPELDRVTLQVPIPSSDSVPSDMITVPGGPYTIASPDAPPNLSATLGDFLLDRHEVTNEGFGEFVQGGGYSDSTHWRQPFRDRGSVRPRAESMRRLVDRTGLPAPREWVSRSFPAERARHPVTGVTWYEADAYCAFRGRRLPTVFEWEMAARAGLVAHQDGAIMPWGYVRTGEQIGPRANFESTGTMPVDAHPFGVSPFGAYDMAGNVKEWVANTAGEGSLVVGGSWEDPIYLFSEYAPSPEFYSSPALGFRCARNALAVGGDQGSGPVQLQQLTPSYRAVDRATFHTLLSHYRYDRVPLTPRITAVAETPDWRRERVWLSGIPDSVLLYLLLPKHAAPPFQTIVLVPGMNVFLGDSVGPNAERLLGAQVKAGRALMVVVMEGMTEQEGLVRRATSSPSSVSFRDQLVRHATQLRRGIDYLAARTDIDSGALAYAGFSWGSGSRLAFAAVDDRFKSVILVGGGIDERMQPTLPEANNINFAAHIAAPTLLLNGDRDEEHPWRTRGLPLWNLLRQPKKLVLVPGGGHLPRLEDRVPAINDWLDRTLGPVRGR